MSVMMVSTSAERLGQIADIGQVAAGGGIREIRRQFIQLGRRGRIARRLGRFRRALQVRRDLLGHLLVLGWVRSPELLERVQSLSERGKLAVAGLRRNRGSDGRIDNAAGRIGGLAAILQSRAEDLLKIAA